MPNLHLEIPNIGCDGCVQAIKMELEDLAGVQAVSGDVSSKTIQIDFDAPASCDAIVQKLKQIDYPPASA